MLGPTLRGKKVSLEPPEADDLSIFRSWFADLEVTRTLMVRFAVSDQQEADWYQRVSTSTDQVAWKIVAEGRPIGTTSLFAIDWINRRAVSGLVIGEKSAWGKGYASETVALRTAYAFRELNLERLESESMTSNAAMHRALEKSGFQKVGLRRRYIFKGGDWHDAYLFELLRDDWQRKYTSEAIE